MATTKYVRKTKTSNRQHTNTNLQLRTNMFTFIAAFMGVAIGFAASLAVVVPMMRSEFASQSQQLSRQLVSMAPASTTLTSCTQPTSQGQPTAQGHLLGASTSNPATPPAGHGGGNTTTPFVKKLVGGVFAKTTAAISDTGPDSTNSITTINKATTTVTNDNNVSFENSNHQDASSGDATSSTNTTGGDAISGDANNDNHTDVSVTIHN